MKPREYGLSSQVTENFLGPWTVIIPVSHRLGPKISCFGQVMVTVMMNRHPRIQEIMIHLLFLENESYFLGPVDHGQGNDRSSIPFGHPLIRKKVPKSKNANRPIVSFPGAKHYGPWTVVQTRTKCWRLRKGSGPVRLGPDMDSTLALGTENPGQCYCHVFGPVFTVLWGARSSVLGPTDSEVPAQKGCSMPLRKCYCHSIHLRMTVHFLWHGDPFHGELPAQHWPRRTQCGAWGLMPDRQITVFLGANGAWLRLWL